MSAAERTVRLHPSWLERLGDVFETQGMADLRAFLLEEKRAGQHVFPPGPEIFAALDRVPFDQVRVVILGQDPYHGPGQAHGLSFSVRRGVPMPPSLVNIFKELGTDLGVAMPRHGELLHWADQGVLLLNASLTVRAHQAGSHADRGWHPFTDRVLREIDSGRQGVAFLLWG
ncbi:MAG: uracil-DNA glycosylase, partial [Myxococcales bacterium]|nr:uracil-DNA glycosylase [Myxococcales bacterium]